MTIESRLKEERLRLGLNQPDFAALAGRTKKTLIDYEKGTSSPDAKFLSAIAAAGADVNYILTGVRVAEVPKMDRQVQMVLELLQGMNKKQRELALSLFAREEQQGVMKTG